MEVAGRPIRTRFRLIDWKKVLETLDELEPGTPVIVGEVDQSIRTHIKNGRYKAIDPSRYDVWTTSVNGSRNRAILYIQRKP